MPKCSICGGEAPRQPCITEDGKCDLCDKEVMLAEAAKKKKRRLKSNLERAGQRLTAKLGFFKPRFGPARPPSLRQPTIFAKKKEQR